MLAFFRRALLVLVVAAFPLVAQNASAVKDLPGVDLSGLTPKGKVLATKILRDSKCPCECGDNLAECRVKDPGCAYSTNLVAEVVQSVKAGRSEADTLAALKTSKWAHVQEPSDKSKLLDDPVEISAYGSPAKGPAAAPVTLVEFSDFQCPYCVVAAGELAQLLKTYPRDVKLIFKQYPLETHPQAALAAAAAIAADKQGKFWPMHDALFTHRNDLSRPAILELAKQNGLDLAKFQADWDSTETREVVIRDVQDGDRVRVEGTPTVFVNGQRFNGQITASALGAVIDENLKNKGSKPTVAAR